MFFFNDTATTEIYALSLHDALPILVGPDLRGRPLAGGLQGRARGGGVRASERAHVGATGRRDRLSVTADRKSTRLNSSHSQISYAVFCLKKTNIPTLPILQPYRLQT